MGDLTCQERAMNGKLPDLICLSHLRWDFVFQRPQHLMTRFAKERRVFFVEEPIFGDRAAVLRVRTAEQGVRIVVPHLPRGLSELEVFACQRAMIDQLLSAEEIEEYVLWYYTPMARPFTRHLEPLAITYDCMDELSAFAGAPPALREREAELLFLADLVTTGGHSLYEAKRDKHPNVHPFPSSVDVAHFARARGDLSDPADQAELPHPRLGFFGVLDERLDRELVRGLAAARPDWQIILVGPVVKIDPETLPKAPNLHYLGGKPYQELPRYIAGWDVALLLFAKNEATRYISPTKTPEYLAAGKPVVSTSIRDVVRPYGEQGLTRIADRVEDFVAAVEASLAEDFTQRLPEVDAFLSQTSWDSTWLRMKRLIDQAVETRRAETSAVAEMIG
jgi:glycosyltransferase involved in cell wall biosynthesis